MNEKSEAKLLTGFIRLIDEPDRAEKKFMKYTKIAMFISVLFVFFCLSRQFDTLENKYIFALLAFAGGVSFGLSIWFLQAGTQTKIMARHMSRASIDQRIDELNS